MVSNWDLNLSLSKSARLRKVLHDCEIYTSTLHGLFYFKHASINSVQLQRTVHSSNFSLSY